MRNNFLKLIAMLFLIVGVASAEGPQINTAVQSISLTFTVQPSLTMTLGGTSPTFTQTSAPGAGFTGSFTAITSQLKWSLGAIPTNADASTAMYFASGTSALQGAANGGTIPFANVYVIRNGTNPAHGCTIALSNEWTSTLSNLCDRSSDTVTAGNFTNGTGAVQSWVLHVGGTGASDASGLLTLPADTYNGVVSFMAYTY